MYVLHKYVRKKWDTFSRHGLDSIKIHIFVLFEEHSMAMADLNKVENFMTSPGHTVGSYVMYNFK